MIPKKEGRGEDSDPILLPNENFNFPTDNIIVLGVFDGMGGAGGAECESDYTVNGQLMTKAYVGSRIVRDAIEFAIKEDPSIVIQGNFSERLKQIINERHAQEKEKHPPKSKVGLRSALIKEYPTTLALISLYKDKNNYTIDSYWAGDSRNYLWTSKGLFQISIDDLKGNNDPLQNINDDAPMSNCIQADGPFEIRHIQLKLPLGAKFALFSATDGCFGYYPSPMDFQKALIASVKASSDFNQLEEKLVEAFTYVTSDDFSFSMAFIGFKKFKDLKELNSSDKKVNQYFNMRRDYEDKVRRAHKLKAEIENLEVKLKEEIQELWPHYKETYMKHMNNYEER